MKTFADLMQDNANICTINTGIKKEYTDTLKIVNNVHPACDIWCDVSASVKKV